MSCSAVRRFARSQHPAQDVTTEDVEDHAEMKQVHFAGPFSLVISQAPHFVRTHREQLGFAVEGMHVLSAAFTQLMMSRQHPIHGANRAVIAASSSKVAKIAAGASAARDLLQFARFRVSWLALVRSQW